MAKYSRQHYEDTAAILSAAYTTTSNIIAVDCKINSMLIVQEIAEEFTELYENDNDRFDRDKFKEACGLAAFND